MSIYLLRQDNNGNTGYCGIISPSVTWWGGFRDRTKPDRRRRRKKPPTLRVRDHNAEIGTNEARKINFRGNNLSNLSTFYSWVFVKLSPFCYFDKLYHELECYGCINRWKAKALNKIFTSQTAFSPII